MLASSRRFKANASSFAGRGLEIGRLLIMKGLVLPPEILARFRSVALERIETLEVAWATLFKGEGNAEIEASLMREIHTLKGDARMVGMNDVARLSHKVEELFVEAQRSAFSVPEDFDLVVTMALRFVAMLLRKKEAGPLGGIDVDGFVQQIDDVLNESKLSAIKPKPLGNVPSSASAPRWVETQDRVCTATQMRLAEAATQVFLEHLQSSRGAAERLHSVWKTLQSEISAFSSVPVERLLYRHQGAAEELARELGKTVRAQMEADGVQLRSEAAEAVDTAVLHAIRNAVDHGIEDAASREKANKSSVGRIVIEARALDDWIEVCVDDDGRGVDLEHVRSRAIELGFLSPERAAAASDQELVNLLFEPGFSTRRHVTDVSGRGVGLDALRNALKKIGGTIRLKSLKGEGTHVCVRVPQASRFIQAHCFRAPGAAIPLSVPAAFHVSSQSDHFGSNALDPLELLQIIIPERKFDSKYLQSGGIALQFQKNSFAIALASEAECCECRVERLCPTSEQFPVEVVLVNGEEGLLLKPGALLSQHRSRAL